MFPYLGVFASHADADVPGSCSLVLVQDDVSAHKVGPESPEGCVMSINANRRLVQANVKVV